MPARGELGRRVRRLVAAGRVRLVALRIGALRATPDGIVVAGEDGAGEAEALPPVDELVATTGFRPDLAPLRELRLALDPALEAPVALAPLIDPNVHSCGTVPPHGAPVLAPPRAGLLRGGDEELRSGAHLPAPDGLRAGALRGRRADRGRGRGAERGAGAPGDRRLLGVGPGRRRLR